MSRQSKIRDLVRQMSSSQIEEYCSRASVWWESQSEIGLRELQEREAAEVLYRKLYDKPKKKKRCV